VAADVWSVTSWGELNRDGVAIEKERLRHPERPAGTPFVTKGTRRRGGAGGRGVRLDGAGVGTDPAVGARHHTSRFGTDVRFSDTRPPRGGYFNTDASRSWLALEAWPRRRSIDHRTPSEAPIRVRTTVMEVPGTHGRICSDTRRIQSDTATTAPRVGECLGDERCRRAFGMA